MKGTVKWFNNTKGYGFISGEDGKDYYVHTSTLGSNVFLKEGNSVNFEPKNSEKGLQADRVTLAQDEKTVVQETEGTVNE